MSARGRRQASPLRHSPRLTLDGVLERMFPAFGDERLRAAVGMLEQNLALARDRADVDAEVSCTYAQESDMQVFQRRGVEQLVVFAIVERMFHWWAAIPAAHLNCIFVHGYVDGVDD